MTIDMHCICGKHLLAPDSAAGKRGKCPTCGRSVSVPKASVPKRPEAGATDAAGGGSESGDEGIKATCVIADSEPRFLPKLVEMFEQHGYKVLFSTTDSQETTEKVRELRPDVVVLDEQLRPTSGFRVIQSLTDPVNPRNLGVWDHIYVMTAKKISGKEKQYGLSLGVEIFVQKPFKPVQVFPRIERRLAHKKH